jgi:hypothetical protein
MTWTLQSLLLLLLLLLLLVVVVVVVVVVALQSFVGPWPLFRFFVGLLGRGAAYRKNATSMPGVWFEPTTPLFERASVANVSGLPFPFQTRVHETIRKAYEFKS